MNLRAVMAKTKKMKGGERKREVSRRKKKPEAMCSFLCAA